MVSSVRETLVLVLVGLAACAGCAEPRSDVNGTVVARFFTPDGPVDVPADLTSYRFQAYADGELVPAEPVVGREDGTFRIGDVPDGAIVVRIVAPHGFTTWQQADGHDVSLIWRYAGRPDAGPVTGSVTLSLELDGLAPWSSADTLVFNCWENGTELSSPMLTPPIADGATMAAATLDWSSGYSFGPSGRPLAMDPAAGDKLSIARLTLSSDGFLSTKLTQIATGPAVDSGTFVATFHDVELANMQRFDLDLDPYLAALPDTPTRTSVGISLFATPEGGAAGLMGPPLVGLSGVENGAIEDSIAFTDTYGNPFDPRWPLVVRVGYEAYLPGTSSPLGDRYYAYTIEPLRAHDHVATPFASFVRNVTLNRQPLAQGAAAWDGNSPLVFTVDASDDVDGVNLDVLRQLSSDSTPAVIARISLNGADRVELPASAFAAGEYQLRSWANADGDGAYFAASRDHGAFALR